MPIPLPGFPASHHGTSGSAFDHDTEHFVRELDEAAQCQMAWTRRPLRRAVLHVPPGDDVLEDEFTRCPAQAQRHGEMRVVLLLDLDEFKRVDNLHGHAAGDLALQHVATLLRDRCRAGEPVFRLGGEEFFTLLQSADREAAERAAERVLQALRDDARRLPGGGTLILRASEGMAQVGAGEPMAAAIGRADDALSAAKAAGGDAWRRAATTC